MKRRAFLSIALVLGCVALGAPWQAVLAEAPPVIVDPLDFRRPIPDPEQGLTQKYDGKVVRFTGAVTAMSLDKRTKKYHYTVSYDIVQQVTVKGKKSVVGKERISVAVTFRNPEKELQKQIEKSFRAKRPGPTLTVDGNGAIHTDGSLDISNAVPVTGKSPFGGG